MHGFPDWLGWCFAHGKEIVIGLTVLAILALFMPLISYALYLRKTRKDGGT